MLTILQITLSIGVFWSFSKTSTIQYVYNYIKQGRKHIETIVMSNRGRWRNLFSPGNSGKVVKMDREFADYLHDYTGVIPYQDDDGWNYIMIDTCRNGYPMNNALVLEDEDWKSSGAVECIKIRSKYNLSRSVDDVSSNASFCVLDESVSLRSLNRSSQHVNLAIASADHNLSPPLSLCDATDYRGVELCCDDEYTLTSKNQSPTFGAIEQERLETLVAVTDKYRKHFVSLVQWVNSGANKGFSTEVMTTVMASFDYNHEEAKLFFNDWPTGNIDQDSLFVLPDETIGQVDSAMHKFQDLRNKGSFCFIGISNCQSIPL
jgi:hypothetical protein